MNRKRATQATSAALGPCTTHADSSRLRCGNATPWCALRLLLPGYPRAAASSTAPRVHAMKRSWGFNATTHPRPLSLRPSGAPQDDDATRSDHDAPVYDISAYTAASKSDRSMVGSY